MQSFKKLWGNKTFKVSVFVGFLFLAMYFLVSYETPSIGAIINKFNPCDDTALQSLLSHCYSGYDLYFCLITGAISFISFLVAIITAIYLSVKKETK